MNENIFRELQQRLDTYSLGFPATDSGVELQILRQLFTCEEAGIFLSLTPKLETPEAVALRTGADADELSEKLEEMATKGLLFRLTRNNSSRYGAIPFMHGLMEFKTTTMTSSMAELLETYFDEGLDNTISMSADTFLRTIPVNRSLVQENHVASFEDACKILKNANPIVITECTCRKLKKVINQACDAPLEACFMFGSMGQYYIDNKMGREISLEEATEILERCNEAGLVTQPGTSQAPAGMCNCCGDCCAVLNAVKSNPKPAEFVFTNHYASLDKDLCSGCGICLGRCQMEALEMNEDSVAGINPDRCIGCGLCVTTCPTGALKLENKAPENLRTPPETNLDQMMLMAKKRGLI